MNKLEEEEKALEKEKDIKKQEEKEYQNYLKLRSKYEK